MDNCHFIRGHVTEPVILSQIDTTTIGNGRAAWAILQGHGQPPRTGLTNINEKHPSSHCCVSPTLASTSAPSPRSLLRSSSSISSARAAAQVLVDDHLPLFTSGYQSAGRTPTPSYKNGNVPSLPLTLHATSCRTRRLTSTLVLKSY
eukprot:4426509-Pleurochrysis_carterae.AAC.2